MSSNSTQNCCMTVLSPILVTAPFAIARLKQSFSTIKLLNEALTGHCTSGAPDWLYYKEVNLELSDVNLLKISKNLCCKHDAWFRSSIIFLTLTVLARSSLISLLFYSIVELLLYYCSNIYYYYIFSLI